MEFVRIVNITISILFTLCYAYQLFYILVPFIIKKEPHKETKFHKYAILIAARNEEKVITHLIKSIQAQTYPSEYYDIYVIADNCTDSTAEVCRQAGAYVYERFNKELIGKGYALDHLLEAIQMEHADKNYDGYLVFDADNLLDEHYLEEMNKTFSDGYRIITSFRNSKNYGDNWISAGYALWFLRESRYLNQSRMLLGTSCAVSGTGFLFHKDVLKKSNGWKFFTLTEDIQFSIYSIINGERIAMCETAVLFDEQPTSFKQSWRQRLRWSKGFLQVCSLYMSKLMKGVFNKKTSFSCYDMIMTISPAMFLSIACILFNLIAYIVALFMGISTTILWTSILNTFGSAYLLLFVVGCITTITERNIINCPKWKKVLYTFTFPIFMLTYIPIACVALFKNVEWKPIEHNSVKTLEDVRNFQK